MTFRWDADELGQRFLKTFRGKLQTDGDAAYADLGERIVHAGCVAHARRTFVDALKVAPQDPLPAEIIERIAQLYAIERDMRLAGLEPASRLAVRQSKAHRSWLR